MSSFVYLNPDASPQGKREIFATVAFRLGCRGDSWTFSRSYLPLQALNPCLLSKYGKAVTLVFSIILETGFKVVGRWREVSTGCVALCEGISRFGYARFEPGPGWDSVRKAL
jgi:hypothetical protein